MGPPLPPKQYFYYLWADFHKIWYEWSGHQWKMTDTIKRKIPTQDGQFLPKTDNSHPIRTILTQDHWRNHRGGRGGPDPHNFQSVGVRPPQLLKSNIIIGYFDQKGRQAIPSLFRRDQNIKNKRLSDDIKQKTK